MNRRLPVVVILVGALVAGLVIDRTSDEDATAEVTAGVADSSVFPIAAGPSALSSTWFCAGGTADEEAFADHSIDIANPTDRDVTVSVTTFGGVVLPPLTTVGDAELDGDDEAPSTTAPAVIDPSTISEPVVTDIVVGSRSREQLRLSDVLAAPVASALVEATSGGIVVEHEVESVHGHDAKPCVTSAARTWHFAWGETTVDARELLVLFNPFPDDAIVDGVFSTEDGSRQPERFDGLVVPARGTVAVDLGNDVTRRAEVAATITARNGRVVVDRILRFDGDERGLTVQSGVPEAQATWVYPDGFTNESIREEYAVYNPSDQLAEVEIEFVVDDPVTNGIPESIDLSLPPKSHQLIDIGADGRVPAGVGHSGIVRSANGVPIIAERIVYGTAGTRKGISVSSGSPVEAETWNFAAGAVTDTIDEWLVLVNLDQQILAQVDVTAIVGGQVVPVSGLQDIELGAGERRAIRVGEGISNRPDLALVVASSEPIVVERGLYRVGDDVRGMSMSVGVPSPDGLRAPKDPLAVETDADLGDVTDPTDGSGDDPDVPVAPDDVELPSPDETIVIEDPDAEADDPAATTTTATPTTAPPASTPETAPS